MYGTFRDFPIIAATPNPAKEEIEIEIGRAHQYAIISAAAAFDKSGK
jgi:hypothetical protein